MQPIFFTWMEVDVVGRDGEIIRTKVMVPFKRAMNVASAQFDLGGEYQLEPAAAKGERSDRSHKHFMATVTEAWRNLPEQYTAEFPTPTHLRKRALIETGFYHLTTTVFDTEKDAIRAAAYFRPMTEFDVVKVEDNVMLHWRAKSQKYLRAGGMGKEEFQDSKNKVLDWLADMITVPKSDLSKAGEDSDV